MEFLYQIIVSAIAYSSSYTSTELSIILTSCLTLIKNHALRYCEAVYERNGKTLFWSIKNSGEILNELKSKNVLACCLSTYDFSTLYTTLPHNLVKEILNLLNKLLTEMAYNGKNTLFTFEQPNKRYE